MTDETTPKRVRGQKEREAAFRAGFLEGVLCGAEEAERSRELMRGRERACEHALVRYRVAVGTAPKRRRKTKADKEADRRAESAQGALDGQAPYVERS